MARQRYLFAAFFSTGLMIPVGYEFGFTKHLHVVKTRPEDWEAPAYDLTDFIIQVNRMKLACPVLLEEGPMARMSPKGKPVVVLVKSRDNEKGRVLAVINTSRKAQKAKVATLADCLGEPAAAWQDLTPEAQPLKFKKTSSLALAPSEMKIFYNPEGKPLPVKKGGKK